MANLAGIGRMGTRRRVEDTNTNPFLNGFGGSGGYSLTGGGGGTPWNGVGQPTPEQMLGGPNSQMYRNWQQYGSPFGAPGTGGSTGGPQMGSATAPMPATPGMLTPANTLRPGAGGMATGPAAGLTPAPRPAPPPNAPTQFAFNGFGTNANPAGVTGGGGSGQMAQWLQALQTNPALANQMLNKDVGFFMGNRDAITQAVGGDLGAWRNSLDSATSNQSLITDPGQLAQIAAFGGGGQSMAGGGLPMPGQTGGMEPQPGMIGGAQPMPGSPGLGAGGNIPLDIASFLDPATGFRIGEATSAVENSAAARGGLLSGSTLRGVSDRAGQVAGDEWSKATDRAFQDRGFNYGVDVGDRDFARGSYESDRNFNFDRERYNSDAAYRAAVDNRDFGYRAQTGDRDYNQRNLQELARMGLAGTQGNQAVMIRLAELLNSNILTGGGASAAGAVGQGADLNAMIMQIVRQLQGNMIVPPRS